jgi:hypothetical protein
MNSPTRAAVPNPRPRRPLRRRARGLASMPDVSNRETVDRTW